MRNRDDLDKMFSRIKENLFDFQNDEFVKYFDNSYYNGNNTVYQKNLSETKKFDMEWITTVESYFPSIDKITKNPKSALKYEEEIVDVERAKKTNAKSIQHLASHTHMIKSIDQGRVIPKKILTTTAEQDFGIYENRFIATLINRLFLFVRNRYLIIKNNVDSFQKDHVYIDSDFGLEEVKVQMKIDLTVTKDLDNSSINKTNHSLLDRVERLEHLIEGLRGSQFMQLLSKTSPVRPPIMKTNIILKNPDFKNAYNLWLFLDKYSTLAYDVDVREKNIKFDEEFNRNMKDLILINFATILGNQSARNDLFNVSEGYEEYTKKRNKQVKKDAEDFVDNPEVIQLEDTTINEYFLNKYKNIFSESVNEIKKEGKYDDDKAFKKALRKITDVVNGMYEAIFKFETEENIFNYLVTKEDLDKDYGNKKYQLKFAKIIREIKEVDYNNAMRRERKLLKELAKTNRKIIKSKTEQLKTEKSEKLLGKLNNEIEKRKKENQEINKRIDTLENTTGLLAFEKDSVNTARLETLNQIKTELNEYKKICDQEIIDEKNALLKELQDLKDSAKTNKTKTNTLLKERQKKLEETINKNQEELLKKLEIEKERIRIKTIAKKEKQAKELREKIAQEKERQAKIKAEQIQKAKEEAAIAKVKAYENKMKAIQKVKKA